MSFFVIDNFFKHCGNFLFQIFVKGSFHELDHLGGRLIRN